MLPVPDHPTPLQSLADLAQFEPSIIAESVRVDCDLGSGIGTHPTLKNPVSSSENTDELLLTEAEETAEEMNIESLAGMLDDLYNGETLPVSRLSELDVALEMDEVEIVEEEPLDDNESDSDADVDHGGGVSEYEL